MIRAGVNSVPYAIVNGRIIAMPCSVAEPVIGLNIDADAMPFVDECRIGNDLDLDRNNLAGG